MAKKQRQDNEVREIVIGWQPVALVLLLVLVVIGGFMVGNLLGGPSEQTAAQTAGPAGAAVAGLAGEGSASGAAQGYGDAGAQPVTVVESSGRVVDSPVQQPGSAGQAGYLEQAAQQDLANRFEPDVVYALEERAHPMRGQMASDFTMTNLQTGEELSLSDYAGKPVFVDFWATWCPPCRIEMPWIQAVHERYGPDELVVLGFNVGEKVPESMVEQQIMNFVESNGMTFPILYGEQSLPVQQDWSVMGYPSAFLIDRDGRVVYVHQGMFPNQATLEHKLAETILGVAPSDS
ncbi:MAG: TlpA family protein disulfide reductase [Anaerolineae bacterium]